MKLWFKRVLNQNVVRFPFPLGGGAGCGVWWTMVTQKMASVVPVGTEVTRQGVSDFGKKGCVMVVKPVARAYILSGHMMSSWYVGDWLLRKKWPTILAMFLALALHAADYFGAFYTLSEVPGVADTVRIYQPTLLSSTMSVLSFLAFTLALVCVLTRVHSQLLWMTLRTFDPWATCFDVLALLRI